MSSLEESNNLTHSVYFIKGDILFAKKYIFELSPQSLLIDLHYEKFGIDESRNLQGFLNQRRDERDIFFITFSSITRESQHSLLKILEDLENTVVVFVFPLDVGLIDTLLSRGQLVTQNSVVVKEMQEYVDTFLKASVVKRQSLVDQKSKELENSDLRKFLHELIFTLSESIKKTPDEFSKLDRQVLIKAEEFLSYPKISPKHVFEYISIVLKK